MYEAVVTYGKGATVGHVTSHHKVKAWKGHECFADQRILDLLKRHPDIFQVTEAGTGVGQHIVDVPLGPGKNCHHAKMAPMSLSRNQIRVYQHEIMTLT